MEIGVHHRPVDGLASTHLIGSLVFLVSASNVHVFGLLYFVLVSILCLMFLKMITLYNIFKKNQLHVVSRTQQGRQREPSVKTLRSHLTAEFWRQCVLSGGTLCWFVSSYIYIYIKYSFYIHLKQFIDYCFVCRRLKTSY